MDLLQYSFTLDPDQPMQAIRERVAAKRDLVCTLPGLRWKAWLISEPLRGRPQPKTYAPLYLFEDTPSIHSFLCGPIYKGVTDAFGWTRPHQGYAITPGETEMSTTRSCALTVSTLNDHETLRVALEEAGRAVALPAGSGIKNAFLGTFAQLDIARMQLRTYAFWACEPEALSQLRSDLIYEVVDVSFPRESP
ncbi:MULTISPECIES: DUF4865 family protein [Ramlibacter]|uniref:DUF4865 family protein n=1 Tax=Ramlibacter aquaticus TaxID=2780094 RepID=A0ABR9SJ01_9BURK|nr:MULTISPECIES: DUF4865 family protein [Ramlibacter]MBE7942341.1 DUF4865 family protein [Ramlibacter aquaticus]